jgi:hypothetical protein
MTVRLLIRVLPVTLFMFLPFGCSDAPSPVGARILPLKDRPVVQRDTAIAVSHSSYRTLLNTTGTSRLLLGKTGEYEAWSMLLFTSLPDSLWYGTTITEAHVELRSEYHFGDSLQSLSLTIYRAVGSFLGDSLTVDSLTNSPTTYYDPATAHPLSLGSFRDTTVVSIPLDTGMVHSWFNPSADSAHANNGIVLQPTNTGVVKGFASFFSAVSANVPALVVTYANATSSGTFRSPYGSGRYHATIPTSSVLLDTAKYLYVQEGVSFRSLLTFDISALPRGSVINQAYAEVWLDASRSARTGIAADSLLSSFVATDGTLSAAQYHASVSLLDSAHNRFYQFDVRDIVQSWLASPAVPRRLSLVGYNETEALDRFVLWGEQAPSGIRPRLRITFSTTPR